jgi:hypothetical protein
MSTYPLTAHALGAVVNDLTSRLGNRVIGPQALRWDEARRAWNLSVDQRRNSQREPLVVAPLRGSAAGVASTPDASSSYVALASAARSESLPPTGQQ